jgi:glycine C-acetyltransferase
MTWYFKKSVASMGYETIHGQHPIVPVMIRNTEKTSELVRYLREKGILAVGLTYPVVPAGDECIRFQISAVHTKDDLDYVIDTLREFAGR